MISSCRFDDESPSCGGNSDHNILVVFHPAGFLPPGARRIAPADSHRYFFLLQTDPPVLLSDQASAPRKSPKTNYKLQIAMTIMLQYNWIA